MQKNMARKHVFFMVKKAKQKVLLENYKCFFRKKTARSLFLLGGLLRPPSPSYGPDFISVNFDY